MYLSDFLKKNSTSFQFIYCKTSYFFFVTDGIGLENSLREGGYSWEKIFYGSRFYYKINGLDTFIIPTFELSLKDLYFAQSELFLILKFKIKFENLFEKKHICFESFSIYSENPVYEIKGVRVSQTDEFIEYHFDSKNAILALWNLHFLIRIQFLFNKEEVISGNVNGLKWDPNIFINLANIREGLNSIKILLNNKDKLVVYPIIDDYELISELHWINK